MHIQFTKAYRIIFNCSNPRHSNVQKAQASLLNEAVRDGNRVLSWSIVLRDNNIIVHAVLRS